MKKITKLLSVLTASALLFTFTGCPSTEDPVDSVDPVKQALDNSSVKTVKMNVTQNVESEEAFVTLMADTVTEFVEYFNSIQNSSRAATTSADAAEQLKKVFDSIMSKEGDVEKLVTEIMTTGKPETDISIDEKIDFENISVADLYKAYVDFINYVNEKISEGYSEKLVYDNDMLAVFNSLRDIYVFDKVYAGVKANFSSGTGDASAAVDLNYQATVKDFNKALNMILAQQKMNAPEADLPVKALTTVVSADADVKTNYNKIMENLETIMGDDVPSIDLVKTVLDLNQKISVGMTIAMCTKDGLGGYITIKASEATDIEKLYKFVSEIAGASEEADIATLVEALDFVNISVSASDGNKVTFSKNYSLKDLYVMVITE